MSYSLKSYENMLLAEAQKKLSAAIIKSAFVTDDIVDAADKGVEEWVWITGYKGTDKNMQCRDYQFELGKQFDMPADEDIRLCYSGFHLCKDLKNVFRCYKIGDGNRFFEVRALVRRYNKNGYYTFEHYDDKMTSKSIEFVRELTAEEVFASSNLTDSQGWTTEQKELAMQTSPGNARLTINVSKLVKLGYSEAFAAFACKRGAYEIAEVMANTPNVSMDVKVLTIVMSIYE